MITAEVFWDTFSRELKSACANNQNWKEYIDNSKNWTNFIMPVIDSTGIKLGFNQQDDEIIHEFYRVDVIYYKIYPNPQAGFAVPAPYINWDLEVAIEHENSYRDWIYNITKLCHINCGLKVIISYHNYGKTAIHEKLNYVKQIYDQRLYKQVPDNWLLLLGPNAYALCKQQKDFIAYKFDGNQFNLLEDREIFRQVI